MSLAPSKLMGLVEGQRTLMKLPAAFVNSAIRWSWWPVGRVLALGQTA
jgi:hypothetical protein